jgi:branched-chain amino acid transport system permease protein
LLGLQLAYHGLAYGAVLALAGLGFAIIFYAARELHFAYGAIIAASGYIVYVCTTMLGMHILFAVLLGLVFAAVLGGAVRYLFFRKLDHDGVLLFGFGLAIVIQNLLQIIFGPTDKVIHEPGLTANVTIPQIGFSLQVADIITIVLAIVISVGFTIVLKRTRFGLAMNAVMKDPDMAELVGVRSQWMKIAAYAIGSTIAAVAAGSTVIVSGVNPHIGFNLLLYAFMITLLSRGRLHLILYIGLAFGVLVNLTAWFLPAQYGTLLVFAVIFAFLLVAGRRTPILAT